MNIVLQKKGIEKEVLNAQRNEITEHYIYKRLAVVVKDGHNRKILEKISAEEKEHYKFWAEITGVNLAPSKFKIFFYVFISRLLGLTFSIKLMEKGEDLAQAVYGKLKDVYPQVKHLIEDEERHEEELISLIDEERLKYVSSVVLGLNDALVELTGALVGLTFALQNTRLVAIVGIITGIAASMSMAASEYLSTKQEDTQKSPLKASVYTGFAYILTVFFLISPYLVFKNIFFCLFLVVAAAVLVIFLFTYYISVAKGLSFKKRFFEMAGISLSIAAINFVIGIAIRKTFGVDI